MREYFCLFVVVIITLTSCRGNINQGNWKDTVESLGDGSYKILFQDIKNERKNILYNSKHSQCVLTDIINYKVIDEDVFFIGRYYNQDIYCILQTKTNCLRYYIATYKNQEFAMVYLDNMLEDEQINILNSYDDFSAKEKDIFEQLKKHNGQFEIAERRFMLLC